jgi:hypothetical protein
VTLPVLVRSYPASGTHGVNAATDTITIDTTGLTDGCVIVSIGYSGVSANVTGASVSVATLDGTNLTQLAAFVPNAGSVTAGAALYGILNPASSGTASLVVTMTGGTVVTPRLVVNVSVWSNVQSFGNVATYNDDSGTTGNVTINLNAATNTVGCAGGFHGDTITGVGASTTICGVANNYINDTAGGCAIQGYRQGVGNPTAINFTSSLVDHWTIHAVELVGTGAVDPPVPTPLTVTAAGTGNSAASSTTLAFNSGGDFQVGDGIVVVISADNNGASGISSLSSVTDAKGNTYTLLQATYDPGAAAAGQTIGIAFAKITTALILTDQITVNFSPATVAKAAVCYNLRPGIGYVLQSTVVASGFGAGSGTGTPTITSSSIALGDCIIAALAVESNAAVTADADTTNGSWSAQATATGNTGTVATSSRIATQSKIVTAAGTQTYNPTLTSADCIPGWASFHVDFVAQPKAPIVLQAVSRAAVR